MPWLHTFKVPTSALVAVGWMACAQATPQAIVAAPLAVVVATAPTSAPMQQPCELPCALAALRPAGQGTMRFLGLRIYDAQLWVAPTWQAQAWERAPVALALTYHRAFTAQAIAQRSVQEIQRQRPLSAEAAQRWTTQLAQWLPDVQAGERLTGLYLPDQGMRLWHGDRALPMLAEPALAQHFFGIWLSPQTSEPALRRTLLGPWAPDAP